MAVILHTTAHEALTDSWNEFVSVLQAYVVALARAAAEVGHPAKGDPVRELPAS